MGVVVPSMSRTIASIRKPAVTLGARRRGGNIRGAEAERLKPGVDAALRVLRRPPGLILEQAHGANPPVDAEIEPMARPARHADQIAALDFDREHGPCRRMDV